MADDEKLKRSVNAVSKKTMLTFTGNVPTIVAGTSIARDWYQDALDQSRLDGRDALRREIVFTSCFLESYIYEWAQSELVHDLMYLLTEIPPYDKDGNPKRIPSLLPKWEDFPKKVFKKTHATVPSLNLSDLEELVSLRDGLVHAKVSKMYIANEKDLSRPEPSLLDLEKKCNGWALNVAVTLVKELHRQYGTPVPTYISDRQTI